MPTENDDDDDDDATAERQKLPWHWAAYASDYNAQFFVARLVNRRNDNGRQMTTLHVNAQVHIRYNCQWVLTWLCLEKKIQAAAIYLLFHLNTILTELNF